MDDQTIQRQRWTENRPGTKLGIGQLRELWQYRELVAFLALRDLRVRYKQAAFGAGWAILQPVAGAAVLTLVFRRLAGVPSDGIPYPLFALVGYSVWTYCSGSVNTATDSFVVNAALVTKIYFPRLGAPIAAVLPGLVDLAIALLAVGAFAIAYAVTPSIALLTLPLWVLLAMLVSLAVGIPLATLNVQYRDAHHAFGLFTQLWFFASPVAYPSSLVHGGWRYLYYLNPMAAVLDGFRWCLVDGPAPPAVAGMSAVTLVVLVPLGLRYFYKTERTFADII